MCNSSNYALKPHLLIQLNITLTSNEHLLCCRNNNRSQYAKFFSYYFSLSHKHYTKTLKLQTLKSEIVYDNYKIISGTFFVVCHFCIFIIFYERILNRWKEGYLSFVIRMLNIATSRQSCT